MTTIENFEIKHVTKGEVIIEGSFNSDSKDRVELTNEIADMVYDNLAEGDRFDVHTLSENEIYYGDTNEEGFSESFIVAVDFTDTEGEFTFTVSHN